jgi:hypothetical protein
MSGAHGCGLRHFDGLGGVVDAEKEAASRRTPKWLAGVELVSQSWLMP